MKMAAWVYCILLTMATAVSVSAADPVPVYVSIVPQKYLLRQIGGDLLDVHVMVDPGANPATYEPKPRQMARLSRTRAYFSIGVPFEKTWLKKIRAANPEMEVIHTDSGIDKIQMQRHMLSDSEGVPPPQTHTKKPIPFQSGRGLDPHIWLSPPLMKVQARTVLSALQKIDAVHAHLYAVNYADFISRIDTLHARLKRIFAGHQGLRFMVFHPAWGYFARTYGLKQIPIEIEGKDPKPAQLKTLIEYARKMKIKVIFVQPQFSTKSAKLVAREIGGKIVFADPMAADWMANLDKIANKFKAAIK